MKWQDLLDHLITVEGECMEENYGKGKALNEADEEINAGIRAGYGDLIKVRSTLMAAPDLLDACKLAAGWLEDLTHGDVDAEAELAGIKAAIAKAEGQ